MRLCSPRRSSPPLAIGLMAFEMAFSVAIVLPQVAAAGTCPDCSYIPCIPGPPPCPIPNTSYPLATVIEFTGFVYDSELGDFLWGVDNTYHLYQIDLIQNGEAQIVSTLLLLPPVGNENASGLGRDAASDLWVTCDRDSRNVLSFDAAGNATGPPSMFPGVLANGVTVGPDQTIWVVDTFDSMIYRRTPEGVWDGAFSSPEGTNLTGLGYFSNLDGLGTVDLGTPPGSSRRLIAMFLDGSCIEACDLEGPPFLRGLAVGEFFGAQPGRGPTSLHASSAGRTGVKSPPEDIEDYDVTLTGQGPGTPVRPSTWGELKTIYR